MSYQHNIDQANDYACLALERIHKENMAPTPDLYLLWYTYYSKININLNKEIDLIIKREGKITSDHCHAVYKKHLDENSSQDIVRQVGDQIQTKITEIIDSVRNVKNATSNYSQTLNGVNNKITTANSIDDIKGVVMALMTETNEMVEKNHKLEQELNNSASTMSKMQKNLETFKKEALTDGLTGLANRKSFDQELNQAIDDSKESGSALSVLMIDIDHFKSFNDNFGHQVGDQVLKLVAKTLNDGVKGRDVSARYGGEEFVVILPETNIRSAVTVAENLRKAIAAKDLVNRQTGEKLGRITISIGAAELSEKENDQQFMERADSAMYTAKHNGRNQVASSQQKNQKKA